MSLLKEKRFNFCCTVMASGVRVLKVASAISKALSEIFYNDFGHLILIADVTMSKDLKYSDVFLYKETSIQLNELDRISGLLRHKLTKYISLRYIPKLRFHIIKDTSLNTLFLDNFTVGQNND